MSSELTPLIMFAFLLLTILIGVPVAFGSGIVALISAFLLWGPKSIFTLITALSSVMNEWTLVAVPLFIFMTMILNNTGIVSDLYMVFYKWSGSLRGGLAVASIIVGAILGAMKGVVAGSIQALGIIALPQMIKYKYKKELAIGSILGGGTLAQLIPPSTLIIVYGSISGLSIGALFAGGLSAGILLVIIYSGYILIKSYFNKELCPGLPPTECVSWGEKIRSLKQVILPIGLVLLVLGAIFAGIATPTEAAGVGCIGALMLALIKKELTYQAVKESMLETLRITSMVGWIMAGASAFSFVFTAVGGDKLVIYLASLLPLGEFGALIFSIVLVVILGMFIEGTAIIVITAPLLVPLANQFGYNPLWFGILFMVCIQSAYLTPPFGMSLFFLKGVVPKDIKLGCIFKSAMPFVFLQILAIIIIIIFPKIVLYLPQLVLNR